MNILKKIFINNITVLLTIIIVSTVFTIFFIKTGSDHHIRYIIRAFLFIFCLYLLLIFLSRCKINSYIDILVRVLKYIFLILIAFLFCLVYLSYEHFKYIDATFNMYDVIAIMQTNVEESFDFILANSAFKTQKIFVATIVLIVSFLVGMYGIKVNNTKSQIRYAHIYALLCLIVSIVAISRSEHLKNIYYAIGSIDSYIKNNELAKEISQKSAPKYLVDKKDKGELYIVIIGESSNKKYMGLYNTYYNTTPKLNTLALELTNEFFLLKNAYASFTHTLQALSYALTPTSVQKQTTGTNFDYDNNLISVLKKADVNVTWISNQERAGIFTNVLTGISELADQSYFTLENEAQKAMHDWTGIYKYIRDYESISIKDDKTNIIFIHLNGSHSKYSKRYPKYFDIYDYKTSSLLGRLDNDDKYKAFFNDYLNSVLYNDYVIYNIYKTYSVKDNFMGMFYFSDHSEDFKYGHNINNFSYDIAKIPAFFILSDAYQKKYPNNINNLKFNLNKPWVNDNVFNTILDMMNIGYKRKDKEQEFSLFSKPEQYKYTKNSIICIDRLIRNDPYFLLKDKFNNIDNHINTIYAHRVNSLFKFFELSYVGIRNFELDIIYDDILGFIIAHDKENDDNLPINSFLYQANGRYDKLWFDIKNISSNNLSKILQELEQLDNVYGIKSKVLIESTNYIALQNLSKLGWNTSIYLTPYDNKEEYFTKIADALNTSQIANISYDMEFYSLVQNKLIPMLNRKVKQLSWNLGLNYTDPHLLDKLKEYKYLNEVIVPYYTNFDK